MSGKWYSPQLSRDLVSRLYFKAKAERIPMTILANRLMQRALDAEQVAEGALETASNPGASDQLAGSVKPPALAAR